MVERYYPDCAGSLYWLQSPRGPAEVRPKNHPRKNTQPRWPAEQNYFKTSFQTESQFVVESIVTDIAEMLYFARNHALPTGKAIVVNSREASGGPRKVPFIIYLTVQLGDSPAIQTKVKISGPIWSEAVYADLTSVLAKSLKLQSPSIAPDEDVSMLEHLTDGLAETIAQGRFATFH